MSSRYQYDGIFRQWRRTTSYIAEYFDVALSILNRGKFQKWHNKCYMAEYFVNGVAVSIWQNISSVASHYLCYVAEYFINGVTLSILHRQISSVHGIKWIELHPWRRIINVAEYISSVASHYQCCIAEYFVSGVALSILYHGKFLWYRVNIIISRNILSMILNEEYCIQRY